MRLNADFQSFVGVVDAMRETSCFFPPGPLGLSLFEGEGGYTEVREIKCAPDGTPSPAMAGGLIAVGDRVSKLNGEDVLGAVSHDVLISMIKSAPRPLLLHFLGSSRVGGVRAASAAGAATAAARRTELLATRGPSSLAAEELWRSGQTLDTVGLSPPGGQVYMYASQALNTSEWARELQRRRLVEDRGATFARSATAEFGALHISLDQTDAEVRAAARAADVAAWRTPRGFVYPVSTTRAADLAHPKAANASAYLAEPYREPLDGPALDAAAAREAARQTARPPFLPTVTPDPLGRPGGGGYADPSTGKRVFGWHDRATGGNAGADFFRSVHLAGAALRAEAEAAAAAERAAWEAKVVTAPAFLPYAPHDATRLERLGSMLRDAPQKGALRDVTHGTIAAGTGARVPPLAPAPVSIFTADAYEPPATLETMLRPLPAPAPGSPGTARARARAAFVAGVDWRAVAEPDVVRGAYNAVHKPLLAAARRVDAPPGARSVGLLPTHARGIDTDALTDA